MLSLLSRQAESYRRKLVKVEAQKNEKWEAEVAPVLTQQKHEIQELKDTVSRERRDLQNMIERAVFTAEAEAREAKRQLTLMCEESTKLRLHAADLERRVAEQAFEIQRSQQKTAEVEAKLEASERLLRARGLRCEELLQEQASMQDQMDRWSREEANAVSFASFRASQLAAGTLSSSASGMSTDGVIAKSSRASMAKKDKLDHTKLQMMLVVKIMIAAYKDVKQAELETDLRHANETVKAVLHDQEEYKMRANQGQAMAAEASHRLQMQQKEHVGAVDKLEKEIRNLRILLDKYRGSAVKSEFVCSRCSDHATSNNRFDKVGGVVRTSTGGSRPSSRISQRPGSSASGTSSGRKLRNNQLEQDDWKAALGELGGEFNECLGVEEKSVVFLGLTA